MNFERFGGLLRRFPAIAGLAVAAWLLAGIVLAAWEMARFEPPSPAAVRPMDTAEDADPAAPGGRLFGTPPRRGQASGAPGVLRDGNFRLTGVVASGDRKLAHAIIETGGVSDAYFPGDTLVAGISLQEVRPAEVLLRRGTEVLRLPLSEMNAASRRGPARNLDDAVSGGLSEVLAEPPQVSLSQLLRMEAVMDAEGRMEGYRVFPRAQKALFDGMGLVSGDLVIAVNGVAFDTGNLTQARRQMSGGGDMILSVLRDGERLEISVGSENFGLLAM